MENRNRDFMERTSHRALGVAVPQVYWERIGIKVNLMGTDIALMLGTPISGDWMARIDQDACPPIGRAFHPSCVSAVPIFWR